MKTYEVLRKEAESVLTAVGELLKTASASAETEEQVNSVACLTDSYARLYEEVQK